MSEPKIKQLAEQLAEGIEFIGPGPEPLDPDNCPLCGGMGFFLPDVPVGHESFGRAIPCNCKEAVRKMRLWRSSGLLEAEREWSLDFFKDMPGKVEAATAARTILERQAPVGWLTVYGSYGVGKSGLLKASVAAAVEAGHVALYRRAEDVLAEARSSFDDDKLSASAVQERYQEVQVLALDEVDRISMTDWAQSFLFSLLDARYNRRDTLATFLATNARIGNMGPEWGYLESRMSDGLVLVMAGRNLRDQT